MQGKVLVLLSICVLPVIHDAVQFRPESVNSLCEHNLLQDDAREILEATFDTFKDWAQGYCLTHSTIQRLASEGLDSRIALSYADELDIAALRLNIGQRNILKVVVKKLREAISRKAREEKEREAAQKQISVERRGRSGSNNDRNIVTGAIGGAMLGIGTLLVAPYALAAVGFTSAGVALGSLGASMMSSAAIANGGGIAAGSTVAVLQSISAAGISVAAETAVVGGGALLGAGAAYMEDNDMEY